MFFSLIIVRVLWFLDCPGPQSETAGKSDSCAGCPNQEVCATAPKGPDPGSPYSLSIMLLSSITFELGFCMFLLLSPYGLLLLHRGV